MPDAVILVAGGYTNCARVLAVLSFETDQVAYLWVRWYGSFADDAARRQNAVRSKKQPRVLRAGINKFDNPQPDSTRAAMHACSGRWARRRGQLRQIQLTPGM